MSNRSKQRQLNQQVYQNLIDSGDLEIKVTRRTHKAKRFRRTKDDIRLKHWLEKKQVKNNI